MSHTPAHQTDIPRLAALFVVMAALIWHLGLQLAPTPWVLTHYYFSYEHEFLKRAFPGTVLRLVGSPDPWSVMTTSLIIIAVVTAALIWSVSWLTRRAQVQDRALLLLFFLGCPAFLGHFLLDLGRYDIFLIFLTLLGIWICAHVRFWQGLGAVMALQTLAILTHEIAFLCTIPISLMALAVLKGRTAKLVPMLLALILLGLITFAVFKYGGSDTQSFDALMSLYHARYDGLVSDLSLRVLFRDLSENAAYSAGYVLDPNRLLENLIVLALFLPFMHLTLGIIARSDLRARFGMPLILIGVFAPLLLSFVGHDQFRWWSFVFANLYLLMWISAFDQPALRDRLLSTIRAKRRLLWITSILFLIVGPMGIETAFWFTR